MWRQVIVRWRGYLSVRVPRGVIPQPSNLMGDAWVHPSCLPRILRCPEVMRRTLSVRPHRGALAGTQDPSECRWRRRSDGGETARIGSCMRTHLVWLSLLERVLSPRRIRRCVVQRRAAIASPMQPSPPAWVPCDVSRQWMLATRKDMWQGPQWCWAAVESFPSMWVFSRLNGQLRGK